MPRSCHGCLPTLVLIDQAVFPLECGQTDRQTRLNALPHAGGYTAGCKQLPQNPTANLLHHHATHATIEV